MRKHKLKVIYLSGSCVVSLPHSAISMVVIAMGAFNIFIFKTTLAFPILWLSFLLAKYFPSLSFSLPALTQSQKMTCNHGANKRTNACKLPLLNRYFGLLFAQIHKGQLTLTSEGLRRYTHTHIQSLYPLYCTSRNCSVSHTQTLIGGRQVFWWPILAFHTFLNLSQRMTPYAMAINYYSSIAFKRNIAKMLY